MAKSRSNIGFWALACALALGLLGDVCAMDITLRMPTQANGNHLYYHRLLTEALRQSGHTLTIVPVSNLPQTRVVLYLESGQLDVNWAVQSKDRDAKFVPVEFGLTHGLIGQRIMLVAKGTEGDYAAVKTLQDLVALNKTAGLGQGWFDTVVWQANDLKFEQQTGDWRNLFNKLASRARGIDYFPRGVTEVAAEALDKPGLAIEPKLLLVYPRDNRFYLSRAQAHLKPILEAALQKAERSGLQHQLLNEYFGPAIAQLNLGKRVRIDLKVPTK